MAAPGQPGIASPRRHVYPRRPHRAPVAKSALNMRTLKAQARGREKAAKLLAAVARMRLKVMKLEHRVTKLRKKIQDYEEKATRLDQGFAPPQTPRP